MATKTANRVKDYRPLAQQLATMLNREDISIKLSASQVDMDKLNAYVQDGFFYVDQIDFGDIKLIILRRMHSDQGSKAPRLSGTSERIPVSR